MNAHILVVEDNSDNSQLVSWILEDEGYGVTCVESGEQCLDLLSREMFDLILMDITLPGMSGKNATRLIRQNPNTSKIPIIALTAHAVMGEQKSILDSGIDCLLIKPLDDEKLLAALRQLLT